MGIFGKVVNAIRGLFGLNKNIGDVFGVTIALSPTMAAKQAEWRNIVAGAANWNDEKTPSLRLAAAVSEEVANRAALGLQLKIDGSGRADIQTEWFKPVVDNLQRDTTEALDGGEIILKPFLTEDGANYNAVDTSSYWPIAYNTRNELIDVIFGAVHQTDKWVYRLLERHTFNAEAQTHTIVYRVFKQEQSANNFTPESLGTPANLADVPDWANLQDITIQGIEQPLFVVVKSPLNEIIERPQRQGIPIWYKAIDQIRKGDMQEAWIQHEFDKSKLKIQVDASYIRTDEETGKKEFDKDLYILYNGAVGREFEAKEFAPPPRIDPAKARMNDILRRIEFLSGLSYGILSDNNMVERTAQEFRSSKERLIVTVDGTRAILETALKHLARSFDVLADLSGIPAGDYEMVFEWSENYKIDREAEASERLKWQAAGNISQRSNIAWWLEADKDSDIVQQEMDEVNSAMQDEFP